MFEIRVICDPADTERVSDALATAFTTGPARQHSSRDKRRTRLYVTAEHRTHTGLWPTPEEAYALAPSVISEVGWVVEQLATHPATTRMPRDFWLRKAAVYDRMALEDKAAGTVSAAADVATETGERLMHLDESAIVCNERAYVRQQYAHWIKHQ
ncbi:hypothetical protein [Streptomyces sp. NBC_00145]|uniref:hypothetical protein n=1 Tax=Streptomyces sp. NBC_00145 TaxID=2975666 RepID=UPI002E198CD7